VRRKLSTEERRRVVAYVMATQPQVAGTELAIWCQVSERAIRQDKAIIRQRMATELREDDVALIIADIMADFRRQIQDIEISKRSAKAGSPAYLAHCTAIVDLRLKTTKMLQDLGYYPKNLGNMTQEHFVYQAVVEHEGRLCTDPPTDTRTIQAT
jgi:DNA primase catalytic subunit